jgi:hypothetical protein
MALQFLKEGLLVARHAILHVNLICVRKLENLK